jgi:hypothetical protein
VKNAKTPVIEELPIIGRLKHLILSATDGCYRTEHLLSLYTDNQLSSRLSHQVEEHLEQCESCKAALVIQQATRQVLAARQIVEPPSYLHERLRQAIAMEANQPAPKIEARHRWLGARLAIAGSTFAAAAVLAVVLLHHNVSPVHFNPPMSSPKVASVPGEQPHSLPIPIVKVHHHATSLIVKNTMIASVPHNENEQFNPVHLPFSSPVHELLGKSTLNSQIGSNSVRNTIQPVSVAKNISTHKMIANHTGVGTLEARRDNAVVPPIGVTLVAPTLTANTPTGPSQVAAIVNVSPTTEYRSVPINDRLKAIAEKAQDIEPHEVQAIASVPPADYAPGEQIVGSGIKR